MSTCNRKWMLSNWPKAVRVSRCLTMLSLCFAVSACSPTILNRPINPELVQDQPRPQIRVAPGTKPTWGDVFGLSVDEANVIDKYRCRDAAIRGDAPPAGC